MAEIARLGLVARARVTQIMNLRLLDLPPTTQGRDRLQYRHVHLLTVTTNWKRQREMWLRLAAKATISP